MVLALVLVSWVCFTCFRVKGKTETAVNKVKLKRRVERMALVGESQ